MAMIGLSDQRVPGDQTSDENTLELLAGIKMPRKLVDGVRIGAGSALIA